MARVAQAFVDVFLAFGSRETGETRAMNGIEKNTFHEYIPRFLDPVIDLPIHAKAAVFVQSINASSAIKTRTDGRAIVNVVLAFPTRKTTRALAGIVAAGVDASGAVLTRIRVRRQTLVHVFIAMTTSPTNRTNALVVLWGGKWNNGIKE